MTTIVVDRKELIMGADMQMDVSGTKFKVKKISRFKDLSLNKKAINCLVATSGDAAAGFLFEKWLEKCFQGIDDKELFPQAGSNFMALVLYEDHSLYLYLSGGQPLEILDRYAGIGSGSDLALGALYAGADIQRAIKIAGKRDSGTGMGIQVESLRI